MAQYVNSDGKSTVPETSKYGVPDGSILGPRLFVLYDADIIKIIPSLRLSSYFYTDNTQTYIFSKPDNLDTLWGIINKATKWMHSNRLCLNPSKAVCLVHNQKTTVVSRQQSNLIQK